VIEIKKETITEESREKKKKEKKRIRSL